MKTNYSKKVLTIVIALAMIFATFMFTACGEKETGSGETYTCTISLDCKAILGMEDNSGVTYPEDGVIVPETKVEFTDGASVEDVLNKVLSDNSIHNTYNSDYGYFSEIANLGESFGGKMSGWVYTVNDESPTVAAKDLKLNKDDVIVWSFITF